MDKTPRMFVGHIVDSAKLAIKYLGEMTKKEFENDQKTQDAITRKIEIIGEASTHLIDDFRKNYPMIPWKRVVGMRNVLVHEYWEIDMDLIWNVVKEKLPILIEELGEYDEQL